MLSSCLDVHGSRPARRIANTEAQVRHRYLRLLAALPLAAVFLYQPAAAPLPVQASLYSKMTPLQKRMLSSIGVLELTGGIQPRAQIPGEGVSEESPTTGPATFSPVGSASSTGGGSFPNGSAGCIQGKGGGGDGNGGQQNVKVNPDCQNLTDPSLQGRASAQNETAIAHDPNNPNHLVAFYNNYQRGDGNCIGAFSLDGGKSWGYSVIPHGFTSGTPFGAVREYWEAGGDPSVAWDTRGNAYMSCQVFQRGPSTTVQTDASSAVYVFRATQSAGASWNFPGHAVVIAADPAGTNPVTGTGAPGGKPFEDKPYMTVDNHVGSPFRDRVYVAYTEFTSAGQAIIYSTFSSDYGQTFSTRVAAVGATSPLCPNSVGPSGTCDASSFADPFTGPDGAYYIVFQNFNNALTSATDNRNQFLVVKSTDGGQTFTPPVKVADYFDLPDCFTYQGKDFGRACVPEKGSSTNSYFRATNYPSGGVNPQKPNEIAVTFGSYINRNSNEANGCVPASFSPLTGQNTYTGVKTPGACNNDILISVSEDAGASFTGTTTDPRQLPSITNASKQRTTDQWWQWAAYTNDGKLAVSYYDRQYGTDETTGFSDVSLSGTNNVGCATDVASANQTCFGTVRATSSSMPAPTQFSGLFYGDYSGVTAFKDSALPLWMDTRNPELFLCPGTGTPGNPPQLCTGSASNAARANDQDIFTAILRIPNGPGEDQGGGGGD